MERRPEPIDFFVCRMCNGNDWAGTVSSSAYLGLGTPRVGGRSHTHKRRGMIIIVKMMCKSGMPMGEGGGGRTNANDLHRSEVRYDL